MEERLKQKARINNLHKVLILVLKTIPMISALCYCMNTFLMLFGVDAPIFSLLCGMSLLPWLFIYIASFVFKFCFYHRLCLYYIIIVDILNGFDYYLNLPVSDIFLISVHLCLTFVIFILVIIFYVKCHKRTSCKLD